MRKRIQPLFSLITIPALIFLSGTPVNDPPVKMDSLEGAVDLHIHTAPDVGDRSINDIELARMAIEHKLRAVVIKCHVENTASRAEMANFAVGKPVVYGGIVLNEQVGGLNPKAVEAMAGLSPRYGKIVWMPTRDASYGKTEGEGISILDESGLVPQVNEILSIIKEKDLVLATGHISPGEIKPLVKEASEMGLKKILLTHPLSLAEPLEIKELKALAAMGALIEITYISTLPPQSKVSAEMMAESIRAIGSEHFILTSDMGQPGNPMPPDGLRQMVKLLTDQGITSKEIDVMIRKNPSYLLGID